MLPKSTISISLAVSGDKQTLSIAVSYTAIVLFCVEIHKKPTTMLIDEAEFPCDGSDPWRGS